MINYDNSVAPKRAKHHGAFSSEKARLVKAKRELNNCICGIDRNISQNEGFFMPAGCLNSTFILITYELVHMTYDYLTQYHLTRIIMIMRATQGASTALPLSEYD